MFGLFKSAKEKLSNIRTNANATESFVMNDVVKLHIDDAMAQRNLSQVELLTLNFGVLQASITFQKIKNANFQEYKKFAVSVLKYIDMFAPYKKYSGNMDFLNYRAENENQRDEMRIQAAAILPAMGNNHQQAIFKCADLWKVYKNMVSDEEILKIARL